MSSLRRWQLEGSKETMKAIALDQQKAITPRLFTYFLAFTIFYIPNQSRIPDIPVPGLNITNLLFLVLFFLVLRNRETDAIKTPLKINFIFYFLVLSWGLLIGQVYDGSTFLTDFQAYKNIVLYMLLFFVAYRGVRDVKTLKFLFFIILFTAFVDTYLGLRQAMDYGFNYNESRRVAAPFSWNSTDANRSAAYYVIYMTLMGVTAFFYKSSRWVRWAALAFLAFGVFVNFFTYSRQSYGIFAVLALILTMRRNLLLGLLILIALFNYHVWLPQSVIARIDMTVESSGSMPGVVKKPLSQELDPSTESRFVIWQGAAEMLADHPLGIGLNHFPKYIGKYSPEHANMDAHNYFVLSTAEDGPLMPFALLGLLLALFKLGRNIEKIDDSTESKVFGIGLWFGAMAVSMVNFYGSRFADGNLMSNFWIFTGLAARYYAIRTQQRQVAAATKSHDELTQVRSTPHQSSRLHGARPSRQPASA